MVREDRDCPLRKQVLGNSRNHRFLQCPIFIVQKIIRSIEEPPGRTIHCLTIVSEPKVRFLDAWVVQEFF